MPPVAVPELWTFDVPSHCMNDTAQINQNDVRQKFAVTAAAYRLKIRVVKILGVIAGAGVAVCIAIHNANLVRWVIPISVSLGAVAFIVQCLAPRLVCPACSQVITLRRGSHCPECGRQDSGNQFGRPCNSCRKTISWGIGKRHFKIRYCAHCGAFLDERGV